MGKYGQDYSEDCRERKTPVLDADYPTVRCPKCGKEEVDMDGFGFVACIPGCGYCTHPSSDGDPPVCGICGALTVWGER